jgi:hypothetical protein
LLALAQTEWGVALDLLVALGLEAVLVVCLG